jgi:hypothetical protein
MIHELGLMQPSAIAVASEMPVRLKFHAAAQKLSIGNWTLSTCADERHGAMALLRRP